MHKLSSTGCTTRPFGSYLKALALLRLVSEQADPEARAYWNGDTLVLSSEFSEKELLDFFLRTYCPTPILAPWNGGSGFYENDRKIGIDAIAGCADSRFAEYRECIGFLRQLPEVTSGKAEKNEEENRRATILRACRNQLPDRAVDWLDASVGIASDGSRSFAPVLGTGGNEGRLDYTNNFMERIAALLISPEDETCVRELLANALFATPTKSFESAPTGQYDPGRAGGVNQGQGVEADAATNPWDFVLTLEGAVAWASGLYRRHGVSYRSFLCSPFTVKASSVGYGSASAGDEARAEIWAPIWRKPARYAELKVLLREGRATVNGTPAGNGIQFAEAATSLGIDRGIDRFMRYNLLKRRGDSYVALPAGEFQARHRSQSDLVRQFEGLLTTSVDRHELPSGCDSLRRAIDSAMYEVLLRGGTERVRALMAALGRLLRRLAATNRTVYVPATLNANLWLGACESDLPEVRIAAALASIWDPQVGSIRQTLAGGSQGFAWHGRDLSERLINVLERRVQIATALESDQNPFGAACRIHPGDASLFIEGSVEDSLIEDLMFAFTCLDWSDFIPLRAERTDVLPIYALLKYFFLPGPVEVDGESKRLRSDLRIISQLVANHPENAAGFALDHLRIAGLRPLNVWYHCGVDTRRLAAALLIPVRTGRDFSSPILHDKEEEEFYA